jgi:hypothetical protein
VEQDVIQKATIVLGFLVAMERRHEFIVHSPDAIEDRVKGMFGDEVLQFVSTALEKAQREMYEADAAGKIYIENMYIPTINVSSVGDRVNTRALAGVPLTYRELAFSDVLRLMNGEKALKASDFLFSV